MLYEVISVLGVKIQLEEDQWSKIVRDKHPVMRGKEVLVKDALTATDFVRRSIKAQDVFLYYKKSGKYYVCVVVRHKENKEGFIMTAYLTDRTKEGEEIWRKSK